MANMLLYDFVQKEKYTLKMFVDDYGEKKQDDFQGLIFQEYDEEFLKAIYWQRKKRKEHRYNIEKGMFEDVEEEIINVAEFGIQVSEKKMLVFGNKQMAQRIITLIGIISKNSYSITEYVVDTEKLINRICHNKCIELLKMKLADVMLDKELLVSCDVNLLRQDDPVSIVLKYIGNIVAISFKLERINTNITVYKTGKVSLSKISDDDKDEMLQKIMEIIC